MLCRIASSLLFIPYLLHNQYRRGSLTQDNHPPTCATLLLHPRLGSTPIPFCVGIGCVTIRLFEAPDKTICSLYTLVCLCMPPSQASLFRSSDRKSTRLNSSHLVISYAVFCLKKKKTKF